jgi:hypothetical protein
MTRFIFLILGALLALLSVVAHAVPDESSLSAFSNDEQHPAANVSRNDTVESSLNADLSYSSDSDDLESRDDYKGGVRSMWYMNPFHPDEWLCYRCKAKNKDNSGNKLKCTWGHHSQAHCDQSQMPGTLPPHTVTVYPPGGTITLAAPVATVTVVVPAQAGLAERDTPEQRVTFMNPFYPDIPVCGLAKWHNSNSRKKEKIQIKEVTGNMAKCPIGSINIQGYAPGKEVTVTAYPGHETVFAAPSTVTVYVKTETPPPVITFTTVYGVPETVTVYPPQTNTVTVYPPQPSTITVSAERIGYLIESTTTYVVPSSGIALVPSPVTTVRTLHTTTTTTSTATYVVPVTNTVVAHSPFTSLINSPSTTTTTSWSYGLPQPVGPVVTITVQPQPPVSTVTIYGRQPVDTTVAIVASPDASKAAVAHADL